MSRPGSTASSAEACPGSGHYRTAAATAASQIFTLKFSFVSFAPV